VAVFATQGGVYLNLISPIGLAFVVHRWFGRKAAGFSLVGMVFLLCGNWPSWAVTTFSPWLFTANFAQGIFFVVVGLVPGAFENPSRLRTLRLGAAVGVLALTHTAPAILIAVLIGTAALVAARRRLLPGRDLVRVVGIVALVGALVSSPFWLPVVLRYRLKVRNPGPSGWVWEEIAPCSLSRFLIGFVGRWPFAVIAVGFLIWLQRRRSRPVDVKVAVLIAWAAWSTFGLIAATYRATRLPGAAMVPNIVPSYHWLLYLSSALCVWFGLAAATLTEWIGSRGNRVDAAAWIGAGAALVALAVSVPAWQSRQELRGDGRVARAMAVSFDDFRASEWIKSHTLSTDTIVYAGPDPLGLIIVGLAGRHSLVTNELFSNPFVDWKHRDADRIAIVESLDRCDLSALRATTSRYGHVSLLVLERPSAADATPVYCPEVAAVALETSAVVIYQLTT
jgi:hypothetical protein